MDMKFPLVICLSGVQNPKSFAVTLRQGHSTYRFGEYLFRRRIIAYDFRLKFDEKLEFSLAQRISGFLQSPQKPKNHKR